MSLRYLTTDVMVQCSRAWVDPRRDRKVLTAIPPLFALLGFVDQTHKALKATEANGAVAAKIHSISDAQTALDQRHDRKLRGTFNLLSGAAEMLDDPKEVATCKALLDLLCPDGLKGTTKSYMAEGGAADRLQGRLDDKQRKLLGKIKIFGTPVIEVVDAWCKDASDLAKLEAEKTNLQNQVDPQQEEVSQAEVLSARNQWMTMVRTIELVMKTAKVEQATVDRILGPVRKAEANAARGGNAAEADSGDGATDEAPPPEAPPKPPAADPPAVNNAPPTAPPVTPTS